MTTEPSTATRTVPVLPTSGVVLPEMVVTIKVETDEATAAVEAAARGDDHVVLVPRHTEASQAVGTLARIEQRGELPGGGHGLVVRGVERVRVGRGSLDSAGALVVDVVVVDGGAHTAETDALATRYRDPPPEGDRRIAHVAALARCQRSGRARRHDRMVARTQ